ncbi:UvrD-helicase domain-containing protein [Acinetobacter johnsonii]|nr:UvrD-helicase domain-containing protein [Acinetobacter johnsonii]QQV09976.1 UvrD-helicase domain-containing protein [Acinetobacter johnsonii]
MNIIANPAEQASLKSLNQIQECINNKNSFRLEAGAGAGKTYSLIESLKYIIKNKSAELADKRVACITYTNVAKDEILNRTDNHPLIYADTIHAFCWELIQPFQANLRNIIGNINKKWREKSKTIPINNQKVKYDFGVMKLTETELFLHHDDVTQCMSLLLQLPKFQKYLKSKFPIIFIDEYQDTDR